jgi:hypothetical protein
MLKKPLSRVLVFLCAVLTIGAPLGYCAPNATASNDISKATIYLEDKSPASVNLAARDLQKYLKQITGSELPISSQVADLKGYVIYLGDTAFARAQGIDSKQLPSDGYRILANKNWMVVAGKDYAGPPLVGFENPFRLNESYNQKLKISLFGDTGTLCGVYYFLEKYCGVRWYMPGELGTVISRRGKLAVPAIDVRRSPVFEQRHVFYGYPETSDDDALWYRRAGYGSPFPVQVNHSFGHWFLKYKDTHPEYFAIIDGKRDFTDMSTSTGGGNYNLTNPGLIQRAIDDVVKYFDENPGQQIFPLSPNDGILRISEDPESQAQIDLSHGETGKWSNYVWGFVNKVATGVYKKYPDKLIGCLAYQQYTLPPSNIERLSPNVAVVITKFRASYPDPKIRKQIEDSITAWSKKANNIYAWEYNCNIWLNPAWKGYPMFFPKFLQEDLKFQKGIVKGEFIEAESFEPEQNWLTPELAKIQYPGTLHPQLYMNARLLWDPDLNVKKTLAEYYKLFYGPAKKPMRGYWDLVESNWNKKSWNLNPLRVYDLQTLKKLQGYLKQAQAQSAPNTLYRQRVDLIAREFNPAADSAIRLSTLSKPQLQVSAVSGGAAAGEMPALKSGPQPIKLLNRKYLTASPSTEMRLGWDSENLYLEMLCVEPNMAKLKTRATERDSMVPPIWEDDAVELFLEPVSSAAARKPETLHLIVTAGGALYDSRIAKVGAREEREWNGNTKASVTKTENGWNARLAIPWTDLGVTNPQAGSQLSANFYRSRYAGGDLEQASWAPLELANFHSPDEFGLLTLGK